MKISVPVLQTVKTNFLNNIVSGIQLLRIADNSVARKGQLGQNNGLWGLRESPAGSMGSTADDTATVPEADDTCK